MTPFVGACCQSAAPRVSARGAVLFLGGMFPQTRYEEGMLALHTGDVPIVFTDGVTEALDPADEEFGEERLKDLLRQVGALPVEEMSARITEELKNWIQDAAQYDDLTFLLMKVK